MNWFVLIAVLAMIAMARPSQRPAPDCALNPIRDMRCLTEVLPIGSNVSLYQDGNRITGTIWGYYLSPETGWQTIVTIDGTSIPTGVFIDPTLVHLEQ